MNFSDSVKAVFGKYAVFNGRARRSEYWYFYLFDLSVFFILYLPLAGTRGNDSIDVLFGILMLLYVGGFTVPFLAVTVRRLHDIDKSGWWVLLGFVPVVSLMLLVWLAQPGAFRTNRFGVSPIPLPIADA